MNFKDFFSTKSWWGKLLGAFFGYLVAGPIGSLLGILIGNFFDKSVTEYFNNPYFFYFSEKQPKVQEVFLETTFSVLGHIAKADGRVSEQEIQMARNLMREMRLNRDQRDTAQALFNEGKQAHFKLDKALNRLEQACRTNSNLLKLFMEIQYSASQVDGLTLKKIQALDAVFTRLGFAPLHDQFRFYEDFSYTAYNQYQKNQQYQSSSSSHSYQARAGSNALEQSYAILQVPLHATQQEIKKAYRHLLSRNHPDKLIAKKLPEDQIRKANDKTQQITKAYELICKNKGWR